MERLAACLLMLLSVSLAARAQTPLQVAEQTLVQCTNQARAQSSLSPLTADSYLATAAHWHSDEMAQLNYFDHLSPTAAQRYPWDRVNLAGADSDFIAEDLYFAEGYPLAQVAALAVNSWLRSPEHRQNLLSSSATRVGCGLTLLGDKIFVTEVFASEVHPIR